MQLQVLRRGAAGSAVAEVRRVLAGLGLLSNTALPTQASYDESAELAVRHFQQSRGLSVDGVVGRETYAALESARWRLGDRVLIHSPSALLVGDDVADLQRQLMELGYHLTRVDHVFGRATEEALRSFQHECGLRVDGVCGPATLRALMQLSARRVVGGRPQQLRDMVAVAAAGPKLQNKRIVIDPGNGGADPGVVHDGIRGADVAWDLATRLDGRLQALGMTSWLTRGPSNGTSDEERAEFANNVGADLVVSLQIDGSDSPRPNGASAYYYGTAASVSWIGERLADLALREIVARTGLLNARTHPKTWSLLRLTRMPTVRVDVGYLSSPLDRARLVDPNVRDAVAEGLLVAIQRLYLPADADPPTGVMRIPVGAA
jgi:N-acetylmuramoyl-L-alanine amidase